MLRRDTVSAPSHFVATNRATPLMVENWKTWQYAQSLSSRTVTERSQIAIRLGEWAGVDPHLVTTEQIVEWLAGGNWATVTRHTYHVALQAWFRWLILQGHRTDNPMERVGKPRRPRSEPRPVSDGNIRRLLASQMHRRTRAMILLAALEGLRVHEIAKVKGEHFDLIARTMVVTGKGGVTATLPVHHLVVEHAYRMPRKGYWFPGNDGGHQWRGSVSDTIKEAMIRAGVAGSAHQLRHWFGTALVAAGVDLRTVQTLMRHSNLTSTAIYTQIADEQRADGIQRLDPFGVGTLRPPAVSRGRVSNATPPGPDDLRRRAAELMQLADQMAAAMSGTDGGSNFGS